jgi:hypothetical protein
MASNGTTLPIQNGLGSDEKPLNRADEVEDVGDLPHIFCATPPNLSQGMVGHNRILTFHISS